jgi:hypothetical protein
LSGDEIGGVLKGIKPVRESNEDKRPPSPSVSVPITHAAPTPPLIGGAAPEPA